MIQSLAEHMEDVSDETLIVFSFDGKILRITCGRQTIAAAATGAAWPNMYLVRGSSLRSLPTRIMNDPVELSFYSGSLHLANGTYPCEKKMAFGISHDC